jgi:hypothetical protein
MAGAGPCLTFRRGLSRRNVKHGVVPGGQVKRFCSTKRTAEGEAFEVLEGGDGRPTKVVHRQPGLAPATSYAPIPKES